LFDLTTGLNARSGWRRLSFMTLLLSMLAASW